MLNKNIFFFRYDTGDYRKFSLIHYISILSFYINNPESDIHLVMNVEPNDSIWYHRLKVDIPSLDIVVETLSLNIDKYDYIHHAIDNLKLELLYQYGGLAVDLDYICMTQLDTLLKPSYINIMEENDPVTYKRLQLAIGFLYSEAEDPFINEWKSRYLTYEKGADWTYYSGKVPYELYLTKQFNNINILPMSYIDTYSYTHRDLIQLFHRNHSIPYSGLLHVSESLSWDRYLKYLDIEYIMTVDTTFNKIARRFVSHLWDQETMSSIIRTI